MASLLKWIDNNWYEKLWNDMNWYDLIRIEWMNASQTTSDDLKQTNWKGCAVPVKKTSNDGKEVTSVLCSLSYVSDCCALAWSPLLLCFIWKGVRRYLLSLLSGLSHVRPQNHAIRGFNDRTPVGFEKPATSRKIAPPTSQRRSLAWISLKPIIPAPFVWRST